MHFDAEIGTLGAPNGYFGLWYPCGPELPHAEIATAQAAVRSVVAAALGNPLARAPGVRFEIRADLTPEVVRPGP
jgi:hypothetical protein